MEIEIEKTCRVCLRQSSELENIANCKIDSTPVLEVMENSLDINSDSILLQESILPNKVCKECVETMTRHSELKKVAKASEAYFNSILGQHFLTSEKVEIPEIFIKHEIVDNELGDQESSMKAEEFESGSEAGPESSADGEESSVVIKYEPTETKARKTREKRHQCEICSKAFEKVGSKDIRISIRLIFLHF